MTIYLSAFGFLIFLVIIFVKIIDKIPNSVQQQMNQYPVPVTTKIAKSSIIQNRIDCNSKKFGANYSITALHSFPGAGNTWTRYLIERATGAFTGSVYVDPSLVKTFPGEKLGSKDYHKLIAVKSHNIGETGWTCNTEKELFETIKSRNDSKCIILIRNPYHAILSEYKRVTTRSHTSSSKLKNSKNFDKKFVSGFHRFGKIDKWIRPRYLETYRTSFNWCERKLVIFYEKLKTDTIGELEKISKFLNSYNEKRFNKCIRLNPEFEGSFHRKTTKKLDPFTKKQKELVKKVVIELNETIKTLPVSYFEF